MRLTKNDLACLLESCPLFFALVFLSATPVLKSHFTTSRPVLIQTSILNSGLYLISESHVNLTAQFLGIGHACEISYPISLFPAEDDSVSQIVGGNASVETIKSQDSLWLLRCKNEKCGEFFDYFGRLRPTSVNCTNCGKRYQYDVSDFERHDAVE
jgi:hypothetical protein